MPISIIDNFDVNAPKNIDGRLGPYDTTASVKAAIDETTQRYLGLTVVVTGSGNLEEYWFQDGVTDSDLVLKSSGGGGGDGTDIAFTYYVSPSGSDVTGEVGNWHKPFQTISGSVQQAVADATAGGYSTTSSVIYVNPGHYFEQALAYNGNFYFEAGAKLSPPVQAAASVQTIFAVPGDGTVDHINVFGNGEFFIPTTTDSDQNSTLLYTAGTGSAYFECYKLSHEYATLMQTNGTSNVILRAKEFINTTGSLGYAFTPREYSTVNVTIDRVTANSQASALASFIWCRGNGSSDPYYGSFTFNSEQVTLESGIFATIIRGNECKLKLNVKNFIISSSTSPYAITSTLGQGIHDIEFNGSVECNNAPFYGTYQNYGIGSSGVRYIQTGTVKATNTPFFKTINYGAHTNNEYTLDVWAECSGSNFGIEHYSNNLYLNKSLYNDSGHGVEINGGSVFIDNYKIIASGSKFSISGSSNPTIYNTLSSNVSASSGITFIGPGTYMSDTTGQLINNDVKISGSLYQTGSLAYFQPDEFAVDALGDTVLSVGQGGTQNVKLGANTTSTEVRGPLTASIISASGNLFASASDDSTIGHVALYNTSSGQFFYTASSAIGGGGITPSQTGSFLTTASAEFSETTFTKGDGSTFQVDTTPRQVIENVKNLESGTLTKGTPVYASGSTGNAINVYAASSSLSTRMPAAYVLKQDLTTGQEGLGILTGFSNNTNTTGFEAGDVLYVHSAGGYTNVKPTGSNLIQNLGKVIVGQSVNGSIVFSGAGRANDIPNITPGYFWAGNSDSVATATPTSSLITDPKYQVYETGSGTDSIKPITSNNNNTVSGNCSTIAGGESHNIGSPYGIIGGGFNNFITGTASSIANAILGGFNNEILDANLNATSFSTIGGGECNQIDADHAVIGGGCKNFINGSFVNPVHSTIGGGHNNYISASSSTIAGGEGNHINLSSECSFIGGGHQNKVDINSQNSVIGGGTQNNIATTTDCGGILGGQRNKLQHDKSFIVGSNLTSSAVCTTFMNNAIIEGNISASGHLSASYLSTPEGNESSISASYAVTASHALNAPGGNTQVDTYMYSWQAGTDSTFFNDGNISIKYDEGNDDIDLVFLTEPSGNGDLVCCTRVFTDGVTPSVDWIDITTQGATYQLAGSIPTSSQVELYIYHVDHPIDTSYPRYKVTVAQDSDSGLYNNNAIVKVYTIK